MCQIINTKKKIFNWKMIYKSKIYYIINSGSTVVLGANLTQISTGPSDYLTNNGLLDLKGFTYTFNNINSSTNSSTGLIVVDNGSLTLNGTTANTLNFRATLQR